MAGKISMFIRDLGFTVLMGALLFYFTYNDSSLHVKCELQNDDSYSCEAIHELLGWEITKLQTKQVSSLTTVSHCSGTGTKRTCTPVPYFLNKAGEEIKMSSNFTGPKAQELVESINHDINAGKSTIDYTGEKSAAFSLICLMSIVPLMLFAAIWKLFLKPKTDGPRTLISWKKD